MDEKGQTIVEYALLTSLCVIFLISAVVLMLDAASDYYVDMTNIICLPLP